MLSVLFVLVGCTLASVDIHKNRHDNITIKNDNDVVIHLKNGDLLGKQTSEFRFFRGIPFAEPPVGDLRFRPPQPKKPWAPAVWNATEYQHNCLQNPSASFMGWPQPLSTLSEDCLYLNVYAPPSLPSTPVPVLFWIFGGGFQGGGGNETRLNGTWNVALMEGKVIIVTFNYRLNAFGFLAADELRGRDPQGSTGNYGIQDQRLAMQWVQQNIAQFGGDPSRVLIVGQSAGAASVSFHLVRKQSWGLFSSAGLESGAFYEGLNPVTVNSQRANFEDFLKRANCTSPVNTSATATTSSSSLAAQQDVVSCLLSVDAVKLLNITMTTSYDWVPTLDGVEQSVAGAVLAAQGALAPVPVLVGSTAEDINPGGINCDGPQCSEADFRKWGSEIWYLNASMVDRLVSLYKDEQARPGGNYSIWYWAEAHAGADQWGGCPARRVARWTTSINQSAYFYRWTYIPKGPNGKYPGLSHHACEQPFIFHVLSETEQEIADDGGVYHIDSSETNFSSALVHYWVNLAGTGHVNVLDNSWPLFSNKNGEGLDIGDSFLPVSQLRGPQCDFWDDIFYESSFSLTD